MKYSFTNWGLPAGNPIASLFVIMVGSVIIVASIVVGFVAFLILGSIVAVLAAAFGLRLWWFNRGVKRRGKAQNLDEGQGRSGVIEGEFRVVEDRRDDRPEG